MQNDPLSRQSRQLSRGASQIKPLTSGEVAPQVTERVSVGVGASTTRIVGRGLAPAVPLALGEVAPQVTERVPQLFIIHHSFPISSAGAEPKNKKGVRAIFPVLLFTPLARLG